MSRRRRLYRSFRIMLWVGLATFVLVMMGSSFIAFDPVEGRVPEGPAARIAVAMLIAGVIGIVGLTGRIVIEFKRAGRRRLRAVSEVIRIGAVAMFVLAGLDSVVHGIDDSSGWLGPLACVVLFIHIGLSYLADRRPKNRDRALPTPVNSPST